MDERRQRARLEISKLRMSDGVAWALKRMARLEDLWRSQKAQTDIGYHHLQQQKEEVRELLPDDERAELEWLEANTAEGRD